MSMLSRRLGEEVVIAGTIRVAIIAVKGDRVRIGITAPLSYLAARRVKAFVRARLHTNRLV